MNRGHDHTEQFVVLDSRTPPSHKKTQAEGLNSDTPDLTTKQLAQRQKQVDFGKNTLGYQEYVKQVPRDERKHWRVVGAELADPVTPDVSRKCSKREWEGRVKTWRRALHKYDPGMSGMQATHMGEADCTADGNSSGSMARDQQQAQLQESAAQGSAASIDAATTTSKKRTFTTAACGKENEGASKRTGHASDKRPQQDQQQNEQEQQGPQQQWQQQQRQQQGRQQQASQDSALDRSMSLMLKSTVADVFGDWLDDDDDIN